MLAFGAGVRADGLGSWLFCSRDHLPTALGTHPILAIQATVHQHPVSQCTALDSRDVSAKQYEMHPEISPISSGSEAHPFDPGKSPKKKENYWGVRVHF